MLLSDPRVHLVLTSIKSVVDITPEAHFKEGHSEWAGAYRYEHPPGAMLGLGDLSYTSGEPEPRVLGILDGLVEHKIIEPYQVEDRIVYVVPTAKFTQAVKEARIPQPADHKQQLALLHPSISSIVGARFAGGHYPDAVEAAFKEVILRVKKYIREKTTEELDGDKAMNRAFGFENNEPLVKVNDLSTQEEKDEQRGIMFLFKGIVGIRNRKAHENVVLKDPARAYEYLALASLLMRVMDEFAK